jgi:hypothetical protein
LKKSRVKFFYVTGILYISSILINKTIKIMGTFIKIESSTATFKTINQAVKYLDAKYGRSGWINGEPCELIYVGGISVYAQYGLRIDPDDTQFVKYKRWEAKYPELNVRLS